MDNRSVPEPPARVTIPAAGDPIFAAGERREELRVLEDQVRHADLAIDARQELLDRVLRLRRELRLMDL